MSRLGLEVARRHGRTLPAFRNRAEARSTLFAQRTASLSRLKQIAKRSEDFVFDRSVESLKSLERWYYRLREIDGFTPLNITQAQFEESMTAYFYSVVIATRPSAKWAVSEHVFTPGRYELGITDDFLSLMGQRFMADADKRGKRRDKLYREYQRYFRLG